MNHYVQQAENFHDEMTILSMKASDDFLSQTRIRLPASSLYLPAKYVLLLQFFYGLKKPVGQKKRYLIVSSDQKKKRINLSFVFQLSPWKVSKQINVTEKDNSKIDICYTFFPFQKLFFWKVYMWKISNESYFIRPIRL